MFIVQLIVCVIVSAFVVVIHDLHVIQENYFRHIKVITEGDKFDNILTNFGVRLLTLAFRYERGILRTLLHEGSACNERLDRGAEQL